MPYSPGHAVYNRDSQLRGDHQALVARPEFWLPVDLDSETKRRNQVKAMTPTPPGWSIPRPETRPIPLERQVVAVEESSVGPNFIHRGQVLDIGHRLVRRYPELFPRPPMPIEPEAA